MNVSFVSGLAIHGEGRLADLFRADIHHLLVHLLHGDLHASLHEVVRRRRARRPRPPEVGHLHSLRPPLVDLFGSIIFASIRIHSLLTWQNTDTQSLSFIDFTTIGKHAHSQICLVSYITLSFFYFYSFDHFDWLFYYCYYHCYYNTLVSVQTDNANGHLDMDRTVWKLFTLPTSKSNWSQQLILNIMQFINI